MMHLAIMTVLLSTLVRQVTPTTSSMQEFLTTSSVPLNTFAIQDVNSTISAHETPISTSRKSAVLVSQTVSDSGVTSREVRMPEPTGMNATTTTAMVIGPNATSSNSGTSIPEQLSTKILVCSDERKLFCHQINNLTLYVNKTYVVAWNSKFFSVNSTVQVKLELTDNVGQWPMLVSKPELWSSNKVPNGWGNVTVNTEEAFLRGYDADNLTFRILNFESDSITAQAQVYDGPTILLEHETQQALPQPSIPSNTPWWLTRQFPIETFFVIFGSAMLTTISYILCIGRIRNCLMRARIQSSAESNDIELQLRTPDQTRGRLQDHNPRNVHENNGIAPMQPAN